MSSLASVLRSAVLSSPDVSRVASLRRAVPVFTQNQSADALYFIEEGLVKLTRTNESGGRIILSVFGSGELVGDEALSEDLSAYQSDAEVVTTASLYKIRRETMSNALRNSSDLAVALVNYLLRRKLALAQKVELLCLHDVEYRILHYLAELSALVMPLTDGEGYQLPITQAELADLVGATRETTSTTLNQLERQGLVKLSRRLLTVSSPVLLRNAAAKKTAQNAAASTA